MRQKPRFSAAPTSSLAHFTAHLLQLQLSLSKNEKCTTTTETSIDVVVGQSLTLLLLPLQATSTMSVKEHARELKYVHWHCLSLSSHVDDVETDDYYDVVPFLVESSQNQ